MSLLTSISIISSHRSMYYTFYCIFFRILTEKLTIEETLFGQQDISCNCLATFKFLRTYGSLIIQKKIATIQSTAQYFKNENIPDEIKDNEPSDQTRVS